MSKNKASKAPVKGASSVAATETKAVSKKDEKKPAQIVYSVAELIKEGKIPTLKALKEEQESYKTYSTGSLMLDLAIGVRDTETGMYGIPERAIVEISGPNSACKSATAEALIKNVLDADPRNHVVALFSEEPRYDRMISVGIDPSRVIDLEQRATPEERANVDMRTAEVLWTDVKQYIQDPWVKLVVVDSLKALCSIREIFDDKTGAVVESDAKEQLCIKAKMITRMIRDFKMVNQRAILFMVNQVSDQVGTSYVANPTIDVRTPGGTGKNYECNIRISLGVKPIETEQVHPVFQKKLFRGWDVEYRVFKNKYAKSTTNRPATGEFLMSPKPGFSNAGAVLKMAVHMGFVRQSGNFYYFFEGTPRQRSLNGANRAKAYLRANPHVMDELTREVLSNAEDFYSLEEETSSRLEDELREDKPDDFDVTDIKEALDAKDVVVLAS